MGRHADRAGGDCWDGCGTDDGAGAGFGGRSAGQAEDRGGAADRALWFGLVGGVLARRAAGAVGQRGQHAQAVGCGSGALLRTFEGLRSRWRSRPMGGRCCRAAGQDAQLWDRPAARCCAPSGILRSLGGVLARRAAGAVGQRGQDAQAVGCGQRHAAAHLRGAFALGHCRWRSRPTARQCCRAARTRRSSCGMRPAARCCAPSRGIRMGSCRWRSRPTGGGAVGQLGQDAQAVGRGQRRRCCAPSRGIRIGSRRWRSRPTGGSVLSGSGDKTLKLWDAASGALLRTFAGAFGPGHVGGVLARRAAGAVGQRGQDAQAVGCGQRRPAAHLRRGTRMRSRRWRSRPTGGSVLSGSWDKTLKLWDAASGALLRTFAGALACGQLGGVLARRAAACCRAARTRRSSCGTRPPARCCAPSRGTRIRSPRWRSRPMARSVLSGSEDKTLKLWDAASGALLRTFAGALGSRSPRWHSRPTARALLSGSCGQRQLEIWDTATGSALVSFDRRRRNEWLTMTPAGFFDASDGGLDMLSVVRGLEPILGRAVPRSAAAQGLAAGAAVGGRAAQARGRSLQAQPAKDPRFRVRHRRWSCWTTRSSGPATRCASRCASSTTRAAASASG